MDYDKFKKDLEEYRDWDNINFKPKGIYFPGLDEVVNTKYGKSDAVNSPAHYTRGTQEAIEIIEEAIQDAPTPKEGMLQAQALKYLLRLWLKDDPKQDAEKARWYLNRLIDSL
jgi:hypothetical protein